MYVFFYFLFLIIWKYHRYHRLQKQPVNVLPKYVVRTIHDLQTGREDDISTVDLARLLGYLKKHDEQEVLEAYEEFYAYVDDVKVLF